MNCGRYISATKNVGGHQQHRQARGGERAVRHHVAGTSAQLPARRSFCTNAISRPAQSASNARIAGRAPAVDVDLVEGDEQRYEADRERRHAGIVASGASPPSSEKNAKIAAPTKKIRRRPSRSASRPPVTISTPKISA